MDLPLKIDYQVRFGAKTDYAIGVIGTGCITNQVLLPIYIQAGLKVFALCDIREDILKETQKMWRIDKAFTDYRKLIELKEVDIVYLAIPPGKVVTKIALDAISLGKHVMVIKPFALSYQEGKQMVEAAEKAGVKLAVDQNARWNPSYRAAYSLIRQDAIGELYNMIHEMGIIQDRTAQQHWVSKMEDFIFVGYGVHHFDLLRWWAGREPRTVYATTTRMKGQNFLGDIVGIAILEFDDELRATLSQNAATQCNEEYTRFRIEGNKGVIRGTPSNLEFYSKDVADSWLAPKLRGGWTPNGFLGTITEFMNAITEEREPTISGRDNLKTLQAMFAAVISAKIRRLVNTSEVEKLDEDRIQEYEKTGLAAPSDMIFAKRIPDIALEAKGDQLSS